MTRETPQNSGPGPGEPHGVKAPDPATALADELVAMDSQEHELARRLRIATAGDSAECIALKLGLERDPVRRALRNGRPTARLLARICQIYGVDGHWLLTGDGPQRRAAEPDVQNAVVAAETLLVEVSTRLASLLAELEQFRERAREEGRCG